MAAHGPANPTERVRVDLVDPCQNHEPGPLKGRHRLAQQSTGQQMPPAEWAGRIDEDDVQVAEQPAMLKPVIHDHNIHI